MTNLSVDAVICLMGPTASGKTSIAVDLVQKGDFEIISVDSAQIYREMDIGTAKPDAKTLKLAPHRLIDFLDPALSYSVAAFIKDANREIKQIQQNGKTPLLVGGSMMYFNALQKGLAKLPDANTAVRKALAAREAEHGLSALHAELAMIDPLSADKINPHDRQRIGRALEVYILSGKTMSELQTISSDKVKHHFYNLALIPKDRKNLHQVIEQRFDEMLESGFLIEMKKLYSRGDLKPDMPSMRSVGYRQFWQYLAGECDYMTARDKAIIATRQLAKRQITWLRAWKDINTIQNHHEAWEIINA